MPENGKRESRLSRKRAKQAATGLASGEVELAMAMSAIETKKLPNVQLQHFTTSVERDARRRHRYWNDVTSSTFEGMTYDSKEQEFQASMWRWSFGDLMMTRPTGGRATVNRWNGGPTMASREHVLLHAQQRGFSRIHQSGRVAELSPMSFEFTNGNSPFFNETSDNHEMIVVQIPRALIDEHIPNIEELFNIPMSGKRVGTRMLQSFLLNIWQESRFLTFTNEQSQDVAATILSLAKLAVDGVERQDLTDRSPGIERQITDFIDANLHDPSLRTNAIAETLRISTRQVQYIFANMETTPSAYIRTRRLERAATMLANDRDRTVLDIAFECGFSDSGYFSRCFRQHFGVQPSSFRA